MDVLSEDERMALASAAEARRSEREKLREQIIARKRVAEAKRAALQEKADRRKEERIQRLRQQLAAVRGITGNTGDGVSQ